MSVWRTFISYFFFFLCLLTHILVLQKKLKKKIQLEEEFPSERVREAYMNPRVDHSTESFHWSRPDLQSLREYLSIFISLPSSLPSFTFFPYLSSSFSLYFSSLAFLFLFFPLPFLLTSFPVLRFILSLLFISFISLLHHLPALLILLLFISFPFFVNPFFSVLQEINLGGSNRRQMNSYFLFYNALIRRER